MSVKMRQKVEREITTAVVDALLKAGYSLEVDNGDEQIDPTANRESILKSMYQTDEERLYVYKIINGEFAAGSFAWVYFVYGNDGWDVISDYTVNLESIIGDGTPVQTLVDEYAD